MCNLHFEKSQKKKRLFFFFPRICPGVCVSFPRILILIMASDPSRRGSNFHRFLDVRRRKNNDILGIFLVGKNCVFSAGPKLLLRTIPKKMFFLGNLLEYIFYHFSSSWLCFFTVFFGLSTTSVGLCEKTVFFRLQKMTFFRVRKNGTFGSSARLRVLFLDHM